MSDKHKCMCHHCLKTRFHHVTLILPLRLPAGPNNVCLFKSDGELSELNSKLLLYYTPQVKSLCW